ncbi:hypothetical protein J4466_01885 [Candidatus Pacearchaeota archaeon]|nr:hypothetical protein [Candidatus Pacearchaeota archaeon]
MANSNTPVLEGRLTKDEMLSLGNRIIKLYEDYTKQELIDTYLNSDN